MRKEIEPKLYDIVRDLLVHIIRLHPVAIKSAEEIHSLVFQGHWSGVIWLEFLRWVPHWMRRSSGEAFRGFRTCWASP
jgi:hypothetical protein